MKTFLLETVNGDTRSWVHTATVNGAPFDFMGSTLTLKLTSSFPLLFAQFSSSDGSIVFGNLTLATDPSSFVAGGVSPYYAAKLTIASGAQSWPNQRLQWYGQWHIIDIFGNPVTDSEGSLDVTPSI